MVKSKCQPTAGKSARVDAPYTLPSVIAITFFGPAEPAAYIWHFAPSAFPSHKGATRGTENAQPNSKLFVESLSFYYLRHAVFFADEDPGRSRIWLGMYRHTSNFYWHAQHYLNRYLISNIHVGHNSTIIIGTINKQVEKRRTITMN
eukprot:scaffold455888_cov18-Prasinocladus_malaysianus.AAC.1